VKRKLLSVVLACVMILSLAPTIALATSTFKDVQNHWAQTAIEKWSSMGIVMGSDGAFRPNDPITRGEMAVVIDRIMKYQTLSQKTFSDLGTAFYTDAILKANAAGVILGDGSSIRPKDSITREEAVVMLGRALGLSEDAAGKNGFADSSSISTWALGYVNVMVSKGYVHGADGKFSPKASITRAEIITILNNAVAELCTEAKEYTGDVSGTVIINVPGVTLNNMTINGDLIIAEGVGSGNVNLNNVKVTGNTIVRGGGEHSIYFNNVTVEGGITVRKDDNGTVRIVVSGSSEINAVFLESGAILVTQQLTGGGIKQVTISADFIGNNPVGLVGAFSSVTNENAGAQIVMTGATITNLNLGASATITGTGTITNANVDKDAGADSKLSVKPGNMTGVGASDVTVTGSNGSTGGGFIADTAAPTMTSLTATVNGATSTSTNGTFSAYVGDTVSSIKILMSEKVTLVGTPVVTMSGGSIPSGTEYGTVTLDSSDASGKTLIITPKTGNETAGLTGTFAFALAVGSVKDSSNNASAAMNFTLTVTTDTAAPTMTSLTATVNGATSTSTNGTFSANLGSTVSSIKVIMSEKVTLVGTPVVTMSGGSIPSGTEYGTVTLDSSDASGKTLIITPKTGNETAGLTGTFTFVLAAGSLKDNSDNQSEEIAFTVTIVNASASGEPALTFDMIKNSNTDAQSITSNLTLPTTLTGATVSWSSSDTNVVSNTGVVTRDSTNDKTVTLTATVSYGSNVLTKTFDLIIRNSGITNVVTDNNDDSYYESGYPMATVTGGKVVIKIKLKKAAEVYVTGNQANYEFDSSVTGVLGGYADLYDGSSPTDDPITIEYYGYQKVTDTTQEYTLTTSISPMSGHEIKLSFVIKDGAYTSANVTAVTFDLATTTAVDTTAPNILTDAYINSDKNKITLYSEEALDTSSVPATTDFVLSEGTVTGVAVTNSSTHGMLGGWITLNVSGVTSTASLTLSYTKATNPIRDASHNAVGSRSFDVVLAAPGISAVYVNAAKGYITVVMNPGIYHNGYDNITASDFTVMNGSNAVTLSNNIGRSSSIPCDWVTMTFTPITSGTPHISVSYTPKSGLTDWAGDAVPTAAIQYTRTVSYISAVSNSVTAAYDSSSNIVTLTFDSNMSLDRSSFLGSYFSLNIGGKDYSLRGSCVSAFSSPNVLTIYLAQQTHIPTITSGTTLTYSNANSRHNSPSDQAGAFLDSFGPITVNNSSEP